jgi:hypothetical protein
LLGSAKRFVSSTSTNALTPNQVKDPTKMSNRDGKPILIRDGTSKELAAIELAGNAFDEAWIPRLRT